MITLISILIYAIAHCTAAAFGHAVHEYAMTKHDKTGKTAAFLLGAAIVFFGLAALLQIFG